MKKYRYSCTVVAMIVGGSWTPAAAQQSNDEWKVLVEPYLMGAATNGTNTIRGRDVDIDASAADIFSNLQLGAMDLVVATKGNWGFGTDVIIDYSTGEGNELFTYDVLTQGPVVGVGFRF